MIPAEAVEAAAKAAYEVKPVELLGRDNPVTWEELGDSPLGQSHKDQELRKARAALEAAAPYMLIHVHHHDIEKHAESFNEGYEAAMAQELADDPTTAQDWLDEKLAAAWDAGHAAGLRREFEVIAHMKAGEPTPEAAPNPHRTAK